MNSNRLWSSSDRILSRVPVKKLSTHNTSWPSASSRSQRWEPRNPAPPVTSIRFLLSKTSSSIVSFVVVRRPAAVTPHCGIPLCRFRRICLSEIETALLQTKNAARPQEQAGARTACLRDNEPAFPKLGPAALDQCVDPVPHESHEMYVVELVDLDCPRRVSGDGQKHQHGKRAVTGSIGVNQYDGGKPVQRRALPVVQFGKEKSPRHRTGDMNGHGGRHDDPNRISPWADADHNGNDGGQNDKADQANQKRHQRPAGFEKLK